MLKNSKVKKCFLVLLVFTVLFTLNISAGMPTFAGDCSTCGKSANLGELAINGKASVSDADITQMQKEAKNKNYTFEIGKNSATKYTINQLCGLIQTKEVIRAPISSSVTPIRALPTKLDPRSSLTPVRNQGSCGSCWTFGTVGVFESALAVKAGIKTDLSEQYLLSCNTQGYSCNGGWWVHEMHQNPGAVPESAFPYAASKVACKSGLPHNYKISSWGYVAGQNATPSYEALKTAIYNYGAVAAAVAVDSYFQSYKGGVFNRVSTAQINHAIVLVGWDDASKSLLLRNSWGSGWGEGGYMWITYGSAKVGYNATYVVVSNVGPTVAPPTQNPSPTPKPSNIVTPTPTGSNPTPIPTGTWKAGVYYNVGAIVTYGGRTYKCQIAHTSIVGWEPTNVPALWLAI